tara:strand:- start:759 stop:1019 length:261 start_codon:yes stop_codon:yes gene_type:complete
MEKNLNEESKQPVKSNTNSREEEEYSKNNNKLANIKFVPIEFDYENYKAGESQVNDALGHGYVVIDNFKTESGLVMVMGLYRSRTA